MAGMRTRSREPARRCSTSSAAPPLFSMATPLEVVVSGYDLDRLREAGGAVRAEMLRDDRFADVKSTVEAGNPEIQIVFDQERASQLGLVVRDIADRVVEQRARRGRHALQAARQADRRARAQRRRARGFDRGGPQPDREPGQRLPGAA